MRPPCHGTIIQGAVHEVLAGMSKKQEKEGRDRPSMLNQQYKTTLPCAKYTVLLNSPLRLDVQDA